ncbi:DNA (cytosine-5-)-methyltransferase [Candidatus Chlorohelix sp.]|uniref:DNA (cytosine-5-)-methyltransferase n=1 Tax=Candidatus Chlorohelix sp. TaxID=3139201 RepID=UPI00306A69CF
MNGLAKISNFDYKFVNREMEATKVSNHIARKAGELVQRRIDLLKIGQKMQDLPEELWHESFRFYVKEDPNRKGGPNLRMIRLYPDKPSPTVTGYIFNKFVHPYENRFITVREAARLQGFPDEVAFQGSLTSTQLQVGNAVPVPLAKAVFESLLQSVNEQFGISQNLTALSLFSGAGGMDIGCEQASYQSQNIITKISTDFWHDACETLQNYYGSNARVIEQDITKIENPYDFWKEYSGESKTPDLIYGGPPCQAFSQAGRQKARDDVRGNLIFEFLKFVQILRPNFFILENVSNLKGVGKGILYKQLIEEINLLGYNLNVGQLLAANFGAPQMRYRLIFMGCRNDIGRLTLPVPTHDIYPSLFTKSYLTVQEAFRNLPSASFKTKL